jgi:hypothetical protein
MIAVSVVLLLYCLREVAEEEVKRVAVVACCRGDRLCCAENCEKAGLFCKGRHHSRPTTRLVLVLGVRMCSFDSF